MGRYHDTPDFIAIDFETATRSMASACSVGIAVVRDGQISDRYYSLIQPPGNEYDPRNCEIHGITPEDTKNAHTFREVWRRDIGGWFGICPVVAHNAKFDMSVLAVCCALYGIEPVNFKYLDTMNLSKWIVDGPKSLAHCAEWFGIPLEDHHNALADAEACAEIALACMKSAGETQLADFCFYTSHILVHNFLELDPIENFQRSHEERPKRRHFENISPKDICPCTNTFDENHPLYGKKIVFTGELSIDRRSAMQLAADVGAIVKSAVSGKTNYLVVGTQDVDLVGADGHSTKEEKAYALNEAGKANIQIITESDFWTLVNAEGKELTTV